MAYRTRQSAGGNRYKSEGERRIAATLRQYHIPFVYEKRVSVEDHGRTRVLYPDFYLPGLDTYVEYYGRVGNEDYDRRSHRKQAAYQSNGFKVVDLYPWDLCQNWPANLLGRLGIAYAAQPPDQPIGVRGISPPGTQ